VKKNKSSFGDFGITAPSSPRTFKKGKAGSKMTAGTVTSVSSSVHSVVAVTSQDGRAVAVVNPGVSAFGVFVSQR
jgi:hypothetical protein